jgi:L-ascorbate metabolism protein UlaG (beta-lactamase superfamily)
LNNSEKLFSIERSNNYRFTDYTGSGVGLWWLGQAGFILRFQGINILLDPYLSDALAIKYKGKKYPHSRMINPPVSPVDLTEIDYFISTHSHSDHMDPDLIPIIRRNNPECKFILPEASKNIGFDRGIPKLNMIGMDDGKNVLLKKNISIYGIASAHEELEYDDLGHSIYLGYIIKFGEITIYHSGDCVPYSGLRQRLEPFKIDLALLPVNGRSLQLKQDGISGNYNFTEAVELIEDLHTPFLIVHHYGMFNFNTVDVKNLKIIIKEQNLESRVYPAELDLFYEMEGLNE